MPETPAHSTDQPGEVKPKGATSPPAGDQLPPVHNPGPADRPTPDPNTASIDQTITAGPTPPGLDDIRADIANRLDNARTILTALRNDREHLNDRIRTAREHVEELERIHHNLNPTPRQPRKKTSS